MPPRGRVTFPAAQEPLPIPEPAPTRPSIAESWRRVDAFEAGQEQARAAARLRAAKSGQNPYTAPNATTGAANPVGGATGAPRPGLGGYGARLAALGAAGAVGGALLDRSGLADTPTDNPYVGIPNFRYDDYEQRPAQDGVMPDRSGATGIHLIQVDGANVDVDVITGRVPPDIGDPVRVTEEMVDALIAGGVGINRDTAVQNLVGNVAVLPDDWRTILAEAGLAVDAVDVASVAAPETAAVAATDSGSGGGREWVDYGNSYRSGGRRSYGGRSYGGGGYGGGGYGGGYGGGGGFGGFPEGFGTGGGMFPGEGFEGEFGSDGDAFAEMMSNPLFSRYFEVLSRSMGPERARLFMRRFGSRFKGMDKGFRNMGKRTKSTRSKTRRPSLSVESADAERAAPDNAAIQESVRATAGKATKGRKKSEDE
jgi:hypothetical protein